MSVQTVEKVVGYYLNGLGVSAERQAAIVASFEDDLPTLVDFSESVGDVAILNYPFYSGNETTETKYGPFPRHRWSAALLLHIPMLLGWSPDEDVTREWTQEFLSWYRRELGRPKPPLPRIFDEVTRLAGAGVPVPYLRAFHPSGSGAPIPVDDILAYWAAGVPIEYAMTVRGDYA